MYPHSPVAQGKAKRGRWSRAERARLRELYGLRDDAAIARELKRPVASVSRVADSLFPPRDSRSGPWTAREVLELKRYLGVSSAQVIARILGRTEAEVRAQILELGRVQRGSDWTREEIGEFKRIYGTRTDEDLARVFSTTTDEILRLASELRLSKDKAFLRKLRGERATRMPRWRAKELDLLRASYASESNLDIARQLGRSVKSVLSKAHLLGLEKSPERLREMGSRNVSVRYRPT